MRSVAEHRQFLESLASKVPNPQAGFFGPSSMAWRLNREMVLGLVVLRALFLQVAHPKVAQGVAEHSNFRRKPFARAHATLKAQQQIVFGTCEQSIEALVRIYARHTVVKGADYQANDPSLLFWVYATLIDSMFFGYRTFLPDLTSRQWDRFYEEGKLFAELFGIPRSEVPASLPAFTAWMQAKLESDEITVSQEGREIGHSLLNLPVKLAAPVTSFLAAGTLPPRLRAQYGLPWSPSRQAWFDRFTALVKGATRVTPQVLHTAPIYWFALARARRNAN